MSGHEPSKTSGNAKAAQGAVRENLGKVIGSNEQQMKGAAKREEGNAEHDAAQAKGWMEGAKDNVMGTVKDTIGSLTGNTQQQAEGKAQDAKGNAKRAANE
jgi:uncharacterized protein YjbJ (UPF0337 family)